MLNCTLSNNSTLGNRLNVVLVEGLFPDQLDQLSSQVAERVGTAGEQRADVKFYLEVSPYFSVTNSHFITGCAGTLFVLFVFWCFSNKTYRDLVFLCF